MDRLEQILDQTRPLAIAVSGGVDSMTLAHVAHRVCGASVRMVHAVSPAVPEAATRRVERHAARNGWRLYLVDAGEMDDPRYRANPLHRCFFCKENLYATIAGLVDGRIASGTNTDDLGDFRPGLKAAQARNVLHPFVEAGMDKAAVYALAASLGLDDLSRLPAQPCLASRVETGIAIEPRDLAFIDAMETRLRPMVGESVDLRCRVTHSGIVIELGEVGAGNDVLAMAAELCAGEARPFLGVRPYSQGAAFLRSAGA